MTTVFVTDGQIRSALAAVRSLGQHDVTVICGESTRFATAFASKYVDETVVYPSPEHRPQAFVEFLESYLTANDVDVLLPIAHEATRLVNKHQNRLAEYTEVPVAGREKFDRLVRKDEVMRQADRLNVPHPKTVFPKSVDDAVTLVDTLTFPVVIKPIDSSGSRGLRYVDSKEDFRPAYSDIHRQYPCPLVQEQVPLDGRGMGGTFLIWDGEVKAQFAYQRLREYPPDGGPSTLRESIHNETILKTGRELLLDADWQGVAMVEFKNDPRTNTPKLMEINPRFWGSLHLPFRAGVDFPWLLVQCALTDGVKPILDYPEGIQCRFMIYGDLLYLLSERNLEAFSDFFPLREPNLFYDIIDTNDPKPILGRLAAMARYSIDPEMWKSVVFR